MLGELSQNGVVIISRSRDVYLADRYRATTHRLQPPSVPCQPRWLGLALSGRGLFAGSGVRPAWLSAYSPVSFVQHIDRHFNVEYKNFSILLSFENGRTVELTSRCEDIVE